MSHFQNDNLGLVASRINRQISLGYFFITTELTDFHVLDTAQDSTSLFPLYIYKPEEKKKRGGFQSMILFDPEEEYSKGGKKPNISTKVFELLEKGYKIKPSPEQILYYCYAVLYSNTYRKKYAEFLKIDFPRIPFTSDYNLFLHMATMGEELTQLHMLKSKSLNTPIVKYKGLGEDLMEKPVYHKEKRIVFINATKYFEGIEPEMWNYHIGGYQVMEKYLKDRKGRQMTDPATYCKIATSIAHTINIQQKIDLVYLASEKSGYL